MKLKVKLLNENATLPTYGSSEAAGLDLYASEDGYVVPDTIKKVHTGIAVAIPKGFVGSIKPRSGLAFKHGIDTMAGVIDSDYRGELKVLLTCHDLSNKRIPFKKGDRIAQLLIEPVPRCEVEESDLDDTERGSDGFGSTGK